ncbi:MAG: siphovirus Gp157 family protein [Oscillospiraceae bacterium]
MQRLFDISQDFEALFDQFDAISEYEFPVDEDGRPVDDDGNPVNPETAKAEMLEAWFDTLSGLEEEFNFKAENLAQYIKCLKAEAEDIDEEMKKLRARRDSRNKRIERLKNYLMENMEAVGITKIDMPKAKITIRKSTPSIKFDNEISFITMLQNKGRDDLLKYSMPEIRKSEIKKLIKSGEKFDGARLEPGRSVIIG